MCVRTDLVKVPDPDRDLAVVPDDVLYGGLGAVHQSVGDPLGQGHHSLTLLLDSEVEDNWLDCDALEKVSVKQLSTLLNVSIGLTCTNTVQ